MNNFKSFCAAVDAAVLTTSSKEESRTALEEIRAAWAALPRSARIAVGGPTSLAWVKGVTFADGSSAFADALHGRLQAGRNGITFRHGQAPWRKG